MELSADTALRFPGPEQHDISGGGKAASKDDFGLLFVANSYAELIRPCDRFFGGLTILTLILAAIGWSRGSVPVIGLVAVSAFMACNILMSQVVLEFRGRSRIRAELSRIFILNSFLCPAVFLVLGGDLLLWWPGYLICVIGAAVVLGSIYPRYSWKSSLGVGYWTVNFAVATFFGIENPNPYQFTLYAGAVLMTGFVFLRFTEAFMQKARLEHEQFEVAAKGLKQAQAQLVESGKLAALGQMAGGIAHEINSPLASIDIAVKQIRRAAGNSQIDPKVLLERADMIQNVTDRISRIVSGLRAFCRDGELEPMREVAIGSLVSDTLIFCEERFRTGEVELIVEKEGLEIELPCRPVQFSQVLLNLLNNAYDAVYPLSERWVRLRAADDRTHVIIVVEDSGTGIPEPARRHIFEPFFTTKQTCDGTGLGLSISKRIIESHGGTIRVDDAAPRTRFVIRIPKRAR